MKENNVVKTVAVLVVVLATTLPVSLIVIALWRQRRRRRVMEIRDIGRVEQATEGEAAYWESVYRRK